MKNAFHVMLIPTLGCPAHCSYCWSSEAGSPKMSIETIEDVISWLKDFRNDRVTFTFHGGEPLLAGAEFYQKALPMLSDELSHLKPDFAMQTNLWLLTPELAGILAEFNVPLGTSIDGPEEINDLQRGEGYFERTMRGYEIARSAGLRVSFICTFTNYSVQFREDIFNFFLRNGFRMKLHPALPSLRDNNPEKWALSPDDYGELLVFLLDKYLDNMGSIEIMNINDLCRCVFTRRGSVCTFVNCTGSTFAVGPDGSIYPCYRFVGMPDWIMGHVRNRPKIEELFRSAAWQRMHQYEEYVDNACSGCTHIRYCRGGCPYNAIVPTGGEVRGVDPHCRAYARIFSEISKRLNDEMTGTSFLDRASFQQPSGKRERPGVIALVHKVISQ
ncbi:MAG: TIGR04083 family peptide-modifying radical SAM enzyme [Methanoregulaceae archaeon]|nr:TIGR04083 family peptide-modifying radical SAM enzyme [Methanoregulaceae archaeon]